jgi:hypothetical protein
MCHKALSLALAGLHQGQKKVKKKPVYIHTKIDFDGWSERRKNLDKTPIYGLSCEESVVLTEVKSRQKLCLHNLTRKTNAQHLLQHHRLGRAMAGFDRVDLRGLRRHAVSAAPA